MVAVIASAIQPSGRSEKDVRFRRPQFANAPAPAPEAKYREPYALACKPREHRTREGLAPLFSIINRHHGLKR